MDDEKDVSEMKLKQTTNREGTEVNADGPDTALSLKTLPDLRFIKAKLPVADVARELGLTVIGNTIQCWRPQNHQHGDRTPSVGIDRKRNRVRCFVCDARAYSAIDLVQVVLSLETRAAIAWIAARFAVPAIPRGRHMPKFKSVSRVGVGGPLERVIRSGLWSQLTLSEKAMLPIFCEFSNCGTECVQLSYKCIERYSGIQSDTTVARALKRFEQLHLLKIHRDVDGALRACNSFELTLDDPQLQSFMAEIYQSEQQEIEAERAIRREQKSHRQRDAALKKLKKNAQTIQFGSLKLPGGMREFECQQIHASC